MPVTTTAPEMPKIRIYPMMFRSKGACFVLPEDLVKVIQYKKDSASNRAEEFVANRILTDFQTKCRKRNLHTIPFDEAKKILVELGYLTTRRSDANHLTKEDETYILTMNLFDNNRFSSPVKFKLSPLRTVMFSSQVLFHLFRTFVCGINWKSNSCPVHANCLQDYKQAIITCMEKYRDIEGKLYNQMDVEEDVAKLEELCYYKYIQGYTLLWVGKKYPSLLDDFFNTIKKRFELPEFSLYPKTELCPDLKFHIIKMDMYVGWMFNFVGSKRPDLCSTIYDAIGLTLPTEVFYISILHFARKIKNLELEERIQSSYFGEEVSVPNEDILSTVDNQPLSVSNEKQEANTGSDTKSNGTTTPTENETDSTDSESTDSEEEQEEENIEKDTDGGSSENLSEDSLIIHQFENSLIVTEPENEDVWRPTIIRPRSPSRGEAGKKLARLIRELHLKQARLDLTAEQRDETQRISNILSSRDSLRPADDPYAGPSAFHVVRNCPEGPERVCSKCCKEIRSTYNDLLLDCTECSSVFHSRCQEVFDEDEAPLCLTCGRQSLRIL
ncbi:unnamed protein product [Caenorhabditis brenneri]